MSDSEDELILEEIRALENALSRQNNDKHSQPEYSLNNLKTETINCSNQPVEEIEGISRFSPVPESVPFSNNENLSENSALALRLNKKLIERLLATREEIVAILEESKRKKEIIAQKLKQRLKTGASMKTLSSHAGMPYFKDKNFFPAPPNEDTKLKESRGELQIIHLRRVTRWTAKDKELLLKAIFNEVVEGLKNLKVNERIDFQSIKLGKNNIFPDIVVQNIGPLGTREFDWMKIAVTDFQNKHSPEECRVMWQIFLHPAINKFKWKKKELSNLEKYVKQHKNENWDAIAKKLDTQRSGYQCFVKYNTMKKMPQNDKPWTKQEDKKLIQLINKFRVGDFINWGDVASCVKTRTKHQIYFRWMYSLAPHLKKGRFTEEEDKLLSDAIEKYGLNFKKISALVLPTRTSAQLSDHHNTLTNKDENVWTIEQDTKLLSLHKEHGKDWAKIATFFDTKSRVQLRHRRSALARYEKRGVDLYQIPRNNFRDKVTKDTVVFQRIPLNTRAKSEMKELDEEDIKLVEYFQSVNVPPAKLGRKQKFYTSQELEFQTRKMYNILNLMSANLCIPYDLDEFECLNEKDKQLLYSLKNLPNDVTDGAFSRKVEELRLKMFDCSKNTGKGHFVPPLPFGGHMKTNKSNQMINYSLYIDTCFTENREMNFETPLNIIKVIGANMSEQYDKIGEFLVSPSYSYGRKPVHQVYILGPSDFMKKEIDFQNQKVNRFPSQPSTSSTFIPNARISSACIETAYNEIDMDNFPSIKPSYATLLGYQGIERVRKSFNSGERIDEVELDLRKMTETGRKALSLLRTRLVQLFKFPIIMSQIMPPETIEERDFIFLPDDENDNQVPTGPSRKKRKIKQEKE